MVSDGDIDTIKKTPQCNVGISSDSSGKQHWTASRAEWGFVSDRKVMCFVDRASCCDSWQLTKLTHNSFLCIYFNSLYVSSNLVLIIRRINCINTTSDICHYLSVTVSCAGLRIAHETVTDTEWHTPDVVLIQLILLMMSTGLLETCRELK